MQIVALEAVFNRWRMASNQMGTKGNFLCGESGWNSFNLAIQTE